MGFLAKIQGGKWDKCLGKFFDQAFLILVKYGTFSIRVVRKLYTLKSRKLFLQAYSIILLLFFRLENKFQL